MRKRQHPLALCLVLVAGHVLVSPGQGRAAETTDPITMRKTVIILKVGSNEPLETRTSFTERPPTITIAFPRWQVISALPERSAIATGLIQTIVARYEDSPTPRSRRFLRTLEIVLAAPYAHTVRSEPGRIIVEINHPASVSGTDVEVGLRGGTIIEGFAQHRPGERFRAMQEALSRATPTPWTLTMSQPIGDQAPSPAVSTERPRTTASPVAVAQPGTTTPARPASSKPPGPSPLVWVGVAIALAIIGTEGARRLPSRFTPRPTPGRPPSGVMLVDQLVWRAFERQGYALVTEAEIAQPLTGTLRVIMKDGAKAALLVIGNGLFFEKQTVQQFLEAMRTAAVDQGFLVASGSFTVPAQRLATEHRITLIGREQLTELLSVGARSEYLTKQLEEQQARVDEAKETLRQYAQELDTMRRQRNEASWFLGEERAKSAALESQVEALSQQLRHHEAEIERWKQDAAAMRRQWEESEWYVGEARSRASHLEGQLTSLQELAARVEQAERERAEANWYLGEERARSEAFEAQLAQLQRLLEDSTARERALQRAFNRLTQEMDALRTLVRERRKRVRVQVAGAQVELRDSTEEPIFAGSPRDLSSAGVGIESDQELPALPSARMRMSLPGHEPIESQAQLKWQRVTEATPPRYQRGYRLVRVPRATRELIEQIVQQSKPDSGSART